MRDFCATAEIADVCRRFMRAEREGRGCFPGESLPAGRQLEIPASMTAGLRFPGGRHRRMRAPLTRPAEISNNYPQPGCDILRQMREEAAPRHHAISTGEIIRAKRLKIRHNRSERRCNPPVNPPLQHYSWPLTAPPRLALAAQRTAHLLGVKPLANPA